MKVTIIVQEVNKSAKEVKITAQKVKIAPMKVTTTATEVKMATKKVIGDKVMIKVERLIKVAYWISSNIAIAILDFSLLLPL